MRPEQNPTDLSLTHCRTIAVVGLSPKPHRDSYRVSQYMQAQGWRIIPVNPLAKEVLGERAYASLTEAAQHERIDMVNCFRNAQDIPPHRRRGHRHSGQSPVVANRHCPCTSRRVGHACGTVGGARPLPDGRACALGAPAGLNTLP